ncbi:MAG TPA: hypothetical protein VFH51_20520, partial [Myxococcota bacterium]|nr:hypothetical protein [Myxococcota bacterium]
PPPAPWVAMYEAALRGDIMYPPHFAVDPFDPRRVLDATAGYRAVVAGASAPSAMPDLAEVYSDTALSYIGIVTPDRIDGAALSARTLVAAKCGHCHNGKFPGISRNDFDFHDFPAQLSDSMKATLRQRLELPADDPLHMPPSLFSILSSQQIRTIEAVLE